MLTKFFKNKSIGYYLACAVAVLSIVLVIVFYATGGTVAGKVDGAAMPNSATSKGPGTIGMFLIGATVVQLLFLVIPTYGIIQVIALVLYGFAFYKEIYCCPQVLAALVTGVAYEGGSLGAHMTYIIMFILIFVLAIVGGFMGYFKKDEDCIDDMKVKKEGKLNVPVLAKLSGVAVLMITAILVSSLVSVNIVNDAKGNAPKENDQQQKAPEVEKYDPITDEIKAAASSYAYDFDPTTIHFEKDELTNDENLFDFTSAEAGISSLPTNGNRTDKHLVYKFEGSYAEGWQGDYSKTYAYLFLWEDGKFAGKSGSTEFRGYWYDGGDGETLTMVTSNNPDGEIIAYKTTGFYSWIVDLNSSVNGGRRIKANGYMYYPEVALFIDVADAELDKVKVGDTVDTSGWTAQRVLKNLKYSSCYEDNSNKVSWKVDGNNISNGIVKVTEEKEYTITAKWGELEASVKFTPKAAETPAE